MKDFEQKLYKEFPKFFDRDRICEFGESGFEIDAGWYELLREFVRKVEMQAKQENRSEFNAIYCGQCKEKFGTLSLYVQNQSEKNQNHYK